MAKTWWDGEKNVDKVQKLITALQNWLSRYSACSISKIPKRTLYDWLEDDVFRTKIEDSEEFWMWVVENKKGELIKEKYRPAIEKELKSKKAEIYWDKSRIEHTWKDWAPIETLDVSKLTPQEIEQHRKKFLAD